MCAPGRWRARCRRLATALSRTSLTSVDLPEPDTPVTQVSTPSGTFTSMSRRLCWRAPRISSVARRLAPLRRHLDDARAGEELAGQRLRDLLHLRGGALRRRSARRARPRPGPRSTRWSAARIVCSSCSTTMHGVARGRAAARACRSASSCRAGAGRSTARRGRRARRRAPSRSASRGGSAAPRRRRASPPPRSSDR